MRDPHERCKPQALLSTHLAHPSAQRLTWLVRRWPREVPCEDARAQLGMATQRQGNDRAIARTTPALLSLSSIIPLTAPLLIAKGTPWVRRTAWDGKTRPTFAEALAWVRRLLWEHRHFSTSQQATDMIHIPRALLERCTDALCYAA
jgi:hypothetical protein